MGLMGSIRRSFSDFGTSQGMTSFVKACRGLNEVCLRLNSMMLILR